MLMGLIGTIAFIFGDVHISSVVLSINSRLYFGAMFVVGFQIIIFSLFAKVYAINSGMHPKGDKFTNILQKITLEKGLVLGIILTLIGIGLSIYAIIIWKNQSFGNLNPLDVMPITINAVYLIIVGIQMAFASFILGILNIEYKK